MKEITITISDATNRALLSQCHRSNAEQKTDLSLDEWVTLLLEETAIAQDLAKEISDCRAEMETEHITLTNTHMQRHRTAMLDKIRED